MPGAADEINAAGHGIWRVFANARISISPESRKSRKSNPWYLQVWQMLNRTRYSSTPLAVERPSITRRSRAKALIACSVLLLFQKIPSRPKAGIGV